MSNKQLLNEDGLSRRDRQNRLYLQGGSCGLQSCGVRQKVGRRSLQYRAAAKGARETRKQGGSLSEQRTGATLSIVSGLNLRLLAILTML